jgi:uncharacterized protein YjiK
VTVDLPSSANIADFFSVATFKAIFSMLFHRLTRRGLRTGSGRTPSRRKAVAFVLFVTLLAVAWISGLPALIYFQAIVMLGGPASGPTLALGDYEAEIQAQPIDGINRDISGLTYSPQTATLFAVANRPSRIIELSTEGRLLRMIELDGVKDPEGLTHVEGDRFMISSERDQSIHWINVSRSATRVTVEGEDRLGLNVGSMTNMGFEGLSWDSERKLLYIAQEMFPARVLLVKGLGAQTAGVRLDISEWKPHGIAGSFMLDLSSASLHEKTGNLILLSHMSRILVEYAPDGTVLSYLPLWRGMNGLSSSIAQAEGVAVGPDGDVFIVGEPNLFYRFAKVSTERPSQQP